MEKQTSIRLYGEMVRLRLIEEAIAELYLEQEMRCPVHLCIGQEAVAVGISASLGKQDFAMSGHRSHGHYLAKGGELNGMMAELYGKVTGVSRGKGGSMHLVDLDVGFLGATPIVASTIPIGVGAAFAASMRGEKRVSVVYFGEGATEEGVFHESVAFALQKKLPVVFVCENNLYSVYSPLSVRQPDTREVYEMARGHGIESHAGDGNDVAEVLKLGAAAVEKARQGGGPTFLEFKTYRWREHCGPNYDNKLGYREEREYLEWKLKCPIVKLQGQLRGQGWLGETDERALNEKIAQEIAASVRFAKESEFPPASELQSDIFMDNLERSGK
jgi:TPP-dependent pyruvate/acetoin dehydrogenase alpha subunit